MKARGSPAHPLRVAMLPLVDVRAEGDGPDAARFTYRGVDYDATVLARLEGEPMHRITEAIAQHLAKARVFAQIILVLDPSQAPEADLLLLGRIYRMRGYVQAEADDGAPRSVLSEVVLKDLTLVDARKPERRLLTADVGWSVLDRRRSTEDGPTPWSVLAETLFVAVDQFREVVEEADLSGRYDVQDEVALDLAPTATTAAFGDLASDAPNGWTFTVTSSRARPIGWKAEDRCEEAHFVQRQTRRFHRILGPYRPTVVLWACPSNVGLRIDDHEEFPSTYLGTRSDRSRYFLRALGETNWRTAIDDVRHHLGVEPPRERYTFELEAVTATTSF